MPKPSDLLLDQIRDYIPFSTSANDGGLETTSSVMDRNSQELPKNAAYELEPEDMDVGITLPRR
ncbi:hypothetical protein D9611_010592 [Ephemerocybe angulata]|uniref:Uncharacterized protein n=1 Tax=Ephemerocybe angulata TaxID=980116 RepID=A0A8H5FB06_9AGAR|nr:hypothetical protein D9611_010592 [Tulosesus angulatus]